MLNPMGKKILTILCSTCFYLNISMQMLLLIYMPSQDSNQTGSSLCAKLNQRIFHAQSQMICAIICAEISVLEISVFIAYAQMTQINSHTDTSSEAMSSKLRSEPSSSFILHMRRLARDFAARCSLMR